jgi:alkylation response protein AidB-like acyl-CoA dehydrogenase
MTDEMKLTALTDKLRQLRCPERFPSGAFDELERMGLLSHETIDAASEPVQGQPPALFDMLVAIGRGDLSVGRLWEGHVNALGLVARLGTEEQRRIVADTAMRGGLLGVWGADDFRRPGRLAGDEQGLAGRKTFASGSEDLAMALVLVRDVEDRARLVLLDQERLAGRFDMSWWRPLGMESTRSAALDLSGIEVQSTDFLGEPDAYLKQPYFGGGAVRFVAVQVGGMLAVWDAMVDHLQRTERIGDPHQSARLGQAVCEAQSAWLTTKESYQRLAPAIGRESGGAASDAVIADLARMTVETAAGRLIDIATRAVGCSGLMEGHPLERALRDLTVYLRQPAPDAALVRLGQDAGSGKLVPSFDAR